MLFKSTLYKPLCLLILVKFEQPEKKHGKGSTENYKRLRNSHFSMEDSVVNCGSFSLKNLVPAFVDRLELEIVSVPTDGTETQRKKSGTGKQIKKFFRSLVLPYSSEDDTKMLAFVVYSSNLRNTLMKNFGSQNYELVDEIQAETEHKMSGKYGGILKGKMEIARTIGPTWKKLIIRPGAYYDCVIPEQAESLWGPVPLERLPEGTDNTCKAVTHSIVDSLTDKKLMSVYLIHSLPLKMSAIQIFVGDKMACVSHLVGEDTIGWEKELELDGEFEHSSWRGMLIKDNSGDWGVCSAAWKGLTPGIPGKPGDRYKKGVKGIPGNPGYFIMHFVNLRTGVHEKITLPESYSSHRRYLFSMTKAAGVTVDLDTGTILLHPEIKYGEINRDIVQNVALAFTVSLLYLVRYTLIESIKEDLG